MNAKKITVGALVTGATVIAGALSAGSAASAVGGALGHAVSSVGAGATLHGAAASSYGLAMLGFGSIAAGGLGMAGGTVLLTCAGAALGGRAGLRLASAFGNEDPSYSIEKVRSGIGGPVLVATGFTTARQSDIDEWLPLIDTRYDNRPVYYVRWGAKEREDLHRWIGGTGGRTAAKRLVVSVAKKATKGAPRTITSFTAPLTALELIRNPWTVAYQRAVKTGYVLADLLSRLDSEPPVLMGHSLGGRVMTATASLVGTRSGVAIEAVHVFGAAVPTSESWRTANVAVTDRLYNYWSRRDMVLAKHFRVGQFGAKAIGQVGTSSRFSRLKDVNVSRAVQNHGDYITRVRRLAG